MWQPFSKVHNLDPDVTIITIRSHNSSIVQQSSMSDNLLKPSNQRTSYPTGENINNSFSLPGVELQNPNSEME